MSEQQESTAAELKETMTATLDLLAMWSRNIAMLPLEELAKAFDQAEAAAPVMDPTLFREYLYSPKAQMIRKLIAAAIPLKKIIVDVQPELLRELEKEKGSSNESPCTPLVKQAK